MVLVFILFLSTPSARRATSALLYSAAFWTIFLSTPSARRATSLLPFTAPPVSYFYPRPPRGGRRGGVFLSAVCAGISIHALREEGDVSGSSMLSRSPNFYPRPPRGGRLKLISFKATLYRFLSTPSARRATIISNNSYGLLRFLSTPSARRATIAGRAHGKRYKFLSTPSARRATKLNSELYKEHDISIHALREEGDRTTISPSASRC